VDDNHIDQRDNGYQSINTKLFMCACEQSQFFCISLNDIGLCVPFSSSPPSDAIGLPFLGKCLFQSASLWPSFDVGPKLLFLFLIVISFSSLLYQVTMMKSAFMLGGS
jgi:hypothetical protein